MNNNVVEKTLKSIDNIDRLSDLAAISIYNTSHEAIDKFDVMQEHATPEYVEGEFVQESLLTGVLIGAGIIGVAISAFLIIKKIIESKAKGDPNAAPNSIKGADLRNPEDIDKAFTKWEKEYFGKHPDMVIDNIKGASPSALGTYAETLTKETNDFITSVNGIIESFMSGTDKNMATDEQMVQQMHEFAESLKGAINIDQLEAANITKDTIGILKSDAISIAKSFRDFDNKINESIKTFEARSKQQHADSEDVKNATETMVKNFSNALKTKAKEIGAIMDSIRSIFEGFQTAIENKVKEAEGQAKAEHQQQDNTGLTPEQKQLIMKKVQARVPEADEHNISDEIARFGVAKSEQELRNLLDAEFEAMESNPNDGSKDSFIRMAAVASEIAQIKGFNWNESVSTLYDLNALTPEGTPKAEPAATRESEEKSDDFDQTQYIDKNRAEEAAARESTEEFGDDSSDDSAKQSTPEQPENAEKKDETPETSEEDFRKTRISNLEKIEKLETDKTALAELDDAMDVPNWKAYSTKDETKKNSVFLAKYAIDNELTNTYLYEELANELASDPKAIPDGMKFNKEAVKNATDMLFKDINTVLAKADVAVFDRPDEATCNQLIDKVFADHKIPEPTESTENADNSEPAKDKNAEKPDKVNITPEMEEKMKGVLLSAGEISQYGVIDESVVNHEIRQIKDMGLFKWTSSQYGDPNNVMSEQQDRCVKINNARYDAACNLAEVMGIDPDLVPKPTPLEQAATHTETPEGTPEAEPAKKEEPVDETEKKDETSSSENANQNIDIKYDGNWVIINGKPVPYSEEDGDNIERKWPDEDNETANKLITGLINRGESPSEAINDINDLWEYGSRDGNIINFLNGVYSSRNRLDNPKDLEIRTECYNKCKIMAEILGEPPVDELPKPDSVEGPSDDIKKISDTTGLDEGKVESIYKLLKDNTTPDAIKRALIIDTISPMMHMSGFNEDMTNKSFATNYANFKKVAEAANMPFEIELPKISEKDINDMHTIVDGAGTDETKLAKIADNLMNSTSTEKKDEGVEGDKEQELLSRITNGPTFAAEVAKAVENGIPEDYARTTLSSLTMSDGKYSLIKERLKDYDWLNDFKQREAYKKAYNHYNDALLYFTDKGIRDIPELKDELPDPTVEFPNALNDENVMQRVLAQYPVNPETLRKDLEYFNTHIPDENLRYIIKDIIPKYFLENAFTKSFEETVNQIRNDDIKVLNLALINANIAEFKPSPEILKQVTDYINANLEKLKSRMTCTILADALVSGTFDPGMIDSETDSGSPKSTAEPKVQPSPSNSSTRSKSGSKQQPTARPTATKQGSGPKQPVRKPVNKPGSGSKQQSKPKQGLFGKIFGI